MTETDRSCYLCLPFLADDRWLMDRLEELFTTVTVYGGTGSLTREELKRVVQEYDVVICGVGDEFDAEVAQAADRLSVLATLSRGVDHIDIEALRERGVEVVNVEEANVTSVAEHTWMLILAVQKRLIESHQAVLEGTDRHGLTERPTEIRGKTVGIVGAGPIGYEVATRAPGFDVECLVWTFNPDQHPEFDELDTRFVTDLQALIEQSDVVTLHIQLSEKTRGLIDMALLADIDERRNRTLINTSRADIVDSEVLTRIGDGFEFNAAGLDVYPETLPDSETGRIYFTPHTAGITQEATRRMRDEVVSKIAEHL